MPVVKDKMVLCQIGLADFSIESVNQVPFYKRYSEFCRLFASKIPSVDFESCFAQPQENNAKKTIEWYFKPGSEAPMKLSELKESDPELYNRLAQQRNDIVNNIRAALNKANENDQKYLNAVLSGFEAEYIDSITYGYDGHILLGIWGMRTKTGRQIDSVITEGVLDHRAYRIVYQIEGEGRITPFTSINRRYGHILHGDKDIPRITPSEGSYFKEWIPEAPHGKEVKLDMVYTAVCEKEMKTSDPPVVDIVDTGGPEVQKDPEEQKEPRQDDKYLARFIIGEHGQTTGRTDYEKLAGETILVQEIPFVTPKEGFRFVGWDKAPDGYVVTEDVEFVAQYEEEDDEQRYEVRFDEGDHGVLHGQTLYEKLKDDKVLPNEVPEVEPEEGYRFIGWDKNPNNHIVIEDVVFVAQYEEVKESWWRRFWGWGSGCLNWLLTLLLLGLIGLLLWYLFSGFRNFNFCGCNCEEYVVIPAPPITPKPEPRRIDTIHEDDKLPKPEENCGVHFSGAVLSDEESESGDIGVIFGNDRIGEYVGNGYYPDNTKTFPKAVQHTFDAIAVDNGTRLILYSEPNFEGRIVLDVVGPVLITNKRWRDVPKYNSAIEKTFNADLQTLFPPSRRQWSSEDMWSWSNGSCKIICEQ